MSPPHPSFPKTGRRRIIWLGAVTAGLGPLALTSMPAHARPQAGDRLCVDDAEGTPVALKPSDVQAGKPLLAFPFDPTSNTIRNDSRLNKVVLVKIDPADMDADTRQRAADGVLAFSAICTHQACEVKTWIAAEKSLVCFCHSSKFLPLQGAKVAAGPAPRSLPLLPLALKNEQLVVAGPFNSPPGSTG